VHANFRNIASFLHPGDLVVVNDSATLPAALTATRDDGATFALHLSTRIAEDIWSVEPRKTGVRAAERVALPGGAGATFLAPYLGSTRLWTARLDLSEPVEAYLRHWGRPITYPYVTREWPIDAYQTVYARRPGSAEMPSAGRAFTTRVLDALRDNGVEIAAITLHTGVASLEKDEPPYPERYEVTPAAADAINAAHASGSRVVAVGTTVVRTLESAADDRGRVQPSRGWTDLVVAPDREIRTVNALLTGFHEPRASHLSMLEAIAGRRHLEHTYAEALRARYLWHEFGDLHLIV
jgi:S-adenosylmethionine:tRNA ribosyltransferase-isomerase